jgi:RimJ/RimL family protein N-acetyltransferase
VEPVLLTERLRLRRLTPADAGHLLALDGDPAVMRFLDSELKTRADIEARVLPDLATRHQHYAADVVGYWAAQTRADGQFLGWAGLRPVQSDPAPMVRWADSPDLVTLSLGYRLRQSAWGHGYATEAARLLIRRAFAHPAVQEIVATTMAVNAPSRRVMEKAGLRYDRTVHVPFDDPLPGTDQGEVEYRLTRAAWEAL